MGSYLTSRDTEMPGLYSYDHYHKTVEEVNLISEYLQSYCSQICLKCDLRMIIDEETLHFQYHNWKLSTLKATLGLFPEKKLKMAEDKRQKSHEYSYLQQLPVSLSLKQLYEIYHTIKDYKKDPVFSQLSQKLIENQESLTIFETPRTPQNQLEKEMNSCEICFDEEPDMALPCGHAFGANCISKYIIDKDEKRCPKCRVFFQGGRSTIQRNLYTIIGQDEKSIYEELRSILLDIMKENNSQQIQEALKCFQRQKDISFCRF